jgi:hypothetical protein
MITRIFCLISFALFSIAGYAQQQIPTEGIVVFDPLFWKDELKLDAFQCRKIKEINIEYYARLSVVAHEEKNNHTLQVKATESLLQRSEEIWETFYPKQRKRWRKMWQENYVPEIPKHT